MLTIIDIKEGNYDLNSANFEYSKERSIYYQRWSNKKSSYSKLSNEIGYNDELMFVDSISCFNENNDIVFISVTLPSSSNSFLSNSSASSKSYTDIYDFTEGVDNVKLVDITTCTNITAYFPIDEKTNVNLEKYKKFNKANIDIYDSNNTAYYNSCYITKGFNYDLTQKYRRMEIFENKTLVSDDCRYVTIDLEMNKIKMFCNYVENFTYSFRIEEEHLNIKDLHKVENLPLKCASYVEKLYENIGFWIYFIFTIIVIIGFIQSCNLFYKTYIKKIYLKPIDNDNLATNRNLNDENGINITEKVNDINLYKKYVIKDKEQIDINEKNKEEKLTDVINVKNNKNTEKNIIENNSDKTSNNNDNKEIEENKSKSNIESSIESEEENNEQNEVNNHPFDNFFVEDKKEEEIIKEEEKIEIIEGYILELENKEPFKNILIRNFLEHFPIISFFNNTFLNDLFINISFFIFNVVLIFGFNAIFYSENMIEKRIFNQNRNKFIYSLSNEIIRLLLSLIFSMIIMLIIRLIILIPRLNNKKILKLHNEGKQLEKEKELLKLFYIRRIISCFIMVIISIFLFYYSIVFCSMYKNTQLNWFISCLWCLLFEWAILCPIYIIIISIVEKMGRSQKISSYYMKQLFLF